MDLGLNGKLILVTGDDQSILNAISKALFSEGAMAVILPNNSEISKLDIEAEGQNLHHITATGNNAFAYKQVISHVIDKYGKIDGLVNVACSKEAYAVQQSGYAEFMKKVKSRLLEFFLVTQQCFQFLKITKGAIINISVSAHADPVIEGGMDAFTREWAVDALKSSVRVNGIKVLRSSKKVDNNPFTGNTKDPVEQNSIIHREERKQLPTSFEELSNVVLFLLSEKSSHTTAQLFSIRSSFI